MGTDNIVTAPFRLAFPAVFVPKAAVQGGKEKYSILMLFPKDGSVLLPAEGTSASEAILAIRKLARDAIVEKWGADKAKWPSNLRNLNLKEHLSTNGKDGWPLVDGDCADFEGAAGHVLVRAKSLYKPGLVNGACQPIINQEEVFGGLICRAQVNAFAYDSAGNKGVSLGLNNLQVLHDDGTSFSGRQAAADVFDAFAAPGAPAAASTGDIDDDFA